MEKLGIRLLRTRDIHYQCRLINSVIRNETKIIFKENSEFPTIESLKRVMSYLDESIENSSLDFFDEILVLELQIILVSSIVVGVSPLDLINSESNGLGLEKIVKDCNYVNSLIKKIKCKHTENNNLFKINNTHTVFQNLNLFLILNGIECTISEEKLQILHGRYIYLLYGNLSNVRNKLFSKFNAIDQIDLILKLGLINNYDRPAKS